MYRNKQYSSHDSSRLTIFIRFIFKRRIRSIVLAVILLLFLSHLFRTGIFLIQHFFGDEYSRDVLELDMTIWRENQQLEKEIPRSIHQIWISSMTDRSMPEKYQLAGQSCRKLHPHYNYTLWTHQNISLWLDQYYPWFTPIYLSYSYDMQRVDAMKYLLLFHYGGLYIDLDIQCKLGDLISAMLPINQTRMEPDMILHMGTEGIAANTDIMASKRFHPCMKLAISQLKSANRWFYLYHLTIILSAGPTYFHGIYRQCPWKERLYYVSNDLLWRDLVEGVGGATWYGRDTILIVFLMKNPILSIFLLIFLIFFLFLLLKLFKRKFY